MVWLAQLTPTSNYVAGVLPGLIILGFALGFMYGTAYFTSTYQVDHQDAGVASALVDTMQQAGGAVGAALLSTIFASALSAYARGKPHTQQVLSAAAVHGYAAAFWVSAAIFAGGALVLAVTFPSINGSDAAGAMPTLATPTAAIPTPA